MTAAVHPEPAPTVTVTSPRTRWGTLFWVAVAFVVLVVLVAIVATWIAPYEASAQNLVDSGQGPSGSHWLGTDQLGRDIFSRLLVGARTGVVGPLVVAIGAGLLGTLLGLWTGYAGGTVDSVVMRTIDLMYAVPPLLVAIVVVGLFGGGYWLAVVVLIVLSAPGDVRIVRAAVMAQRELPYVAAARTVGVAPVRIAVRHVLPNVAPTVVANVLLQFVVGLIALSGLAFLGLGVAAGSPDWGLMVAENRGILDLNPWAVIAPAVGISLLAIAVTVIGDRVFEMLSQRTAAR
jgi:ABC-type dipeptide/oligopeptide/nickel transport system permease subunit